MHDFFYLLAIAQFTVGFYLLFALLLSLAKDCAPLRLLRFRQIGKWMAELLRLP